MIMNGVENKSVPLFLQGEPLPAGYFDPPLTTFAFPYHEYVAQTLECLFAGALPGCRKIRMPLVVRKTAAPPGKAAPVLPQGCPADPVRQKNKAKEPA